MVVMTSRQQRPQPPEESLLPMPKKKQPVSDEILATIASRSESELRNAIGAHAVAVKTIKDEMDGDPDVVAAKAALDAAKEKYKEQTGPYKADMKAEDALLNANHEELMRRGVVATIAVGEPSPSV